VRDILFFIIFSFLLLPIAHGYLPNETFQQMNRPKTGTSLPLLRSKSRTMVQAARQSSVLLQIAGTVVGAIGSDHTGAVLGSCGFAQQSRPLWIQYRQVLSSASFGFRFLLLP